MSFRKMREKAELTQVEAAKELNVSQGAISNWENGISLPVADKLPEIARLYGCTIDDLFKDGE